MYETGGFPSRGFYPSASSCSSNTSSPDSSKYQRLLVSTTPSPPHAPNPYFQQQYFVDPHRSRFNPPCPPTSNSNGSSEIHSSSSSTTSSHDQLHSWFLAQASVPTPQSRFCHWPLILSTRWCSVHMKDHSISISLLLREEKKAGKRFSLTLSTPIYFSLSLSVCYTYTNFVHRRDRCVCVWFLVVIFYL